ncbi:hypothetical protein RclHR1_02880006 [Rhizophagus clarus]|uniref:2-dehydropantoate 2-reductase n=1 Tax=Rhizophagus clarus TaxID=94130 RepID=A0A2Z6R4A6_9GLOM|nr:hypothetical protein RclHR1_02880006 [Rhizophagus clarus]GET02161.1 2-dehydropantoate 2-reductase [Rhizophagus clarus]
MVSIAILGCGNLGFYIASHLIHNNHNAFCNPYDNNKILCIGRQRLLDELNLSKILTVTKLNNFIDNVKESDDLLKEKKENDDDECEENIVISNDEIVYETDLKELIKFNPDYVIVTLKSHQISDVFKELKHLDGKTTIISIQSCLHNAEIIKQYLPNTKIIRGLLNEMTITHKPDSLCHFIQKSSSLGSIILESTPDTLKFQKILEQNELPCEISYDIEDLMYFKLLINLNTSLFALSGLSYDEYLQGDNFKEIYRKCVLEGLNVYRLNGITFGDNLLMKKLTKCLDYVPEWVSMLALEQFFVKRRGFNPSMIDDLKLSRKTEVEFLQGEIVKLSEIIKKDNQKGDEQRERNVDVKYNKGILGLIKMIENKESKNGWDVEISDKEILKYIETGEVPNVL